MKKIKWICLIVGIIGIIILTFIFVKQNNQSTPEKKFDIADTYNTAWHKSGVAYYEQGELFSENLELVDDRYILFYEDYVEYHNPTTNQVDKYEYIFDKEKEIITINSEDYLLSKGTYNISFDNNYLKLSQSIDGNDYIYYFESALG